MKLGTAIKKYQFRFDLWGLLLFLLIMIPNFIWFAIPAPHDVLREESVTPVIDTIASFCQAVMLAAICLLKRSDIEKITMRSKWLLACTAAVFLYYVCWVGYYFGFTEKIILLSLAVLPCIAFIFYIIDRKNWIVFMPAALFTVLHIIYCYYNFMA